MIFRKKNKIKVALKNKLNFICLFFFFFFCFALLESIHERKRDFLVLVQNYQANAYDNADHCHQNGDCSDHARRCTRTRLKRLDV